MAHMRQRLDPKLEMALENLAHEELGLNCLVCLGLPNDAVQLPRGESLCADCAEKLTIDPNDNSTPLSSADKIPNRWARIALPLMQGLAQTLKAERKASVASAEHEQVLAATIEKLQILQKNYAMLKAENKRLLEGLKNNNNAAIQKVKDEKAKSETLAKKLVADHQREIQTLRDTLQQEMKPLLAERKQLQQELDDWKAAHTALSSSSRQDARDHKTIFDQLQAERGTLKAELKAMTTAHKAAQNQYANEIAKALSHQQQLQQTFTEIRQMAQAATTKQQAQVKELAATNSRLQTELDITRSTVKSTVTLLDTIQARLEHTQAEATLHAEKLTAELATAKAEIAQLKQDRAAQNSKTAALLSRSASSPAVAGSQHPHKRASAPAAAVVNVAHNGRSPVLSAQRTAAANQNPDKKHETLPASSTAAGAGSEATTLPMTQRRASLPYASLGTHPSGMHTRKRHSEGSGLDDHTYNTRETEANRLIETKLTLNKVRDLSSAKADNCKPQDIDTTMANNAAASLKAHLLKLANGMNFIQLQKFARFVETRLIEKFKFSNNENELKPTIAGICVEIDPKFVLTAKATTILKQG